MADTPSSQSKARYDQFADWYVSWVGDSPGPICDPRCDLLPADLAGERWLDVACGSGRASRELARRGASAVGVDISPELIVRARDGLSAGPPRDITYVVGDVTKPAGWWDGAPFDGALCETALMDIDDLEGTLAAVAQVLRSGGRFLASFVNPCFPGNEVGLSSWPPEDGYQAEGFWTSPHHNPNGVRLRVGSIHRTLSTYMNAVIDAGLRLERVWEPATQVPTLLALASRLP